MFNLSKKTEYGLMALSYLSALDSSELANVSEIARSSSIPKELLAKILSELVKAGMAESQAGPAGGYRMARPATEVSLADVVRALEKNVGLICCGDENSGCDRTEACTIRSPMTRIHDRVNRILEETKLSDLLGKPYALENFKG